MIKDKIIALAAVAALSTIASPAFAQSIDGTPQSLVPTSEDDGHTFHPMTRNNAVAFQSVSPDAYLPVLVIDNSGLRQIEQSTQSNASAIPTPTAPFARVAPVAQPARVARAAPAAPVAQPARVARAAPAAPVAPAAVPVTLTGD